MITVIVADDHTMFREGLISLLKEPPDIEVVGDARDGLQAMELIRAVRPELAILDVTMPQMGGIAVAEAIAEEGLDTKVVLLTVHIESYLVNAAFAAGVWGYVVKDNAFTDLVYAIRAVHRGGRFISPSVAAGVMEDKLSVRKRLTKREQEVLSEIARGLTNREIARKLCISVKTVETHRTRMMQKLGVHSTAELVLYAIKAQLL